jgi:hypothetical protein
VHPEDVRPAGYGGSDSCCSPVQAPVDFLVQDLADERLARRPHQHRPAQGIELPDAVENGQVVPGCLAEADARIDYDLLPLHPGSGGPLQGFFQKRPDLSQQVFILDRPGLHGLGNPAHVHHNQGSPGSRHHLAHLLVEAQRADVVDHGRPGIQRRLGHPGLGGVYAHRHGGVPGRRLDHREHPFYLFILGHRLRSRPGGLAAHVQDVRPLLHQPQGLVDSLLLIEELAPVRE